MPVYKKELLNFANRQTLKKLQSREANKLMLLRDLELLKVHVKNLPG